MSLSITVIKGKTFSVLEDNGKSVPKHKEALSNTYTSAKGADLRTVFSVVEQKSAQKKSFYCSELGLKYKKLH